MQINFANFALNSSAVREALGVELGVVVAEVHLEAEDLVELPLDAELLQRVVLDLGCKIRRKGFLFGVGQVLQIWYI